MKKPEKNEYHWQSKIYSWCKNGSVQGVEEGFLNGSNFEMYLRNKWTALTLSCSLGHIDIVNTLVK